MRVMLVDDEEWCLEELADVLCNIEEVDITGAYTCALEVMDAAVRDGPDIIFMDVQMPGMTGLELAKQIKSELPGIRIVLLSEKECFARNGFDIGVDNYIMKPLRQERVLKALERQSYQ